ncbi:MAG: CAP domain-containing protein [Anaerolineales bacterium]
MHKNRIFFWIAAGLLFLAAARPAKAVPAESHARQAPSPYELIEAVNALRTSNGLPAYTPNAILMQIAQNQADYQASIGTVTHSGPDGSRPYQRALAAGYPLAGDLSLGGFISENVFHGSSVEQAMTWWYNSPPHYNTMMSTMLQEIGAGVAGTEGSWYFTIVAARPTGASNSSSGNISTPAAGTRPPTPFTTVTVHPSTPNPDGSLVHVVQPGETVWQIALAYGVSEQDIIRLNPQMGTFIYPGDTLLIRTGYTPTPTAPTPTPTLRPTATAWPTLTPTAADSPTPTRVPSAAMPRTSGIAAVSIIILAALLVAGGLTFLGVRGRR